MFTVHGFLWRSAPAVFRGAKRPRAEEAADTVHSAASDNAARKRKQPALPRKPVAVAAADDDSGSDEGLDSAGAHAGGAGDAAPSDDGSDDDEDEDADAGNEGSGALAAPSAISGAAASSSGGGRVSAAAAAHETLEHRLQRLDRMSRGQLLEEDAAYLSDADTSSDDDDDEGEGEGEEGGTAAASAPAVGGTAFTKSKKQAKYEAQLAELNASADVVADPDAPDTTPAYETDGTETRRLAVVNLDWDHVRSLDILAALSGEEHRP